MKKNVFSLLMAAFVLCLLPACARDLIPEEVLQIPEYSQVYTAYNLWYNADGVCRSENVQQGGILPFGTEIEFMKANSDGIHFRRVSDGKEFYLKYSEYHSVIPIENYIKRLFVLRNEKDLAIGIRPLVYEKIRRGIVEKGMTRNEVLLAYGPPPAMSTPSETVDTWIYWRDYGVGRRIVFFGDRVVEIIELQ